MTLASDMRDAAAALLATPAGTRPQPSTTTRRAAGSSTGPSRGPGSAWPTWPDARKAAHRLLATALSPPAYAQAMAVIALEEVLDRREGWRAAGTARTTG